LMGAFMSDGYLTDTEPYVEGRYVVCWVLNSKDLGALQRCKTICEEVFQEVFSEMTFEILDAPKSSVYKLSAGCARIGVADDFARAWNRLFYNDRGGKRVPEAILNAPANVRRAFWEGLHDVGGSREPEITLRAKKRAPGYFICCALWGTNASWIL